MSAALGPSRTHVEAHIILWASIAHPQHLLRRPADRI